MKKLAEKISERPIVLQIVLSLTLNLIIEMLGRRSVFQAIAHAFTNPLVFAYNSMVIFFTFLAALFFKRRLFAQGLIAVLWLTLGIVNCVVLGFRTTPLAAIDFQIIFSALSVVPIYLNLLQMILILASVLLGIALLARLFSLSPKTKPKYVRALILCAVVMLCLTLSTKALLRSRHLSEKFSYLPESYLDYGFVYCFSCSLLNKGISMPENYSAPTIDTILSEIGAEHTNCVQTTPDIIFVQLESFIDPNRFNGISFSENPVPNFTTLKKESSTGFLTVPSIGAGTANVEFETLCGMNLDFFGPGEYPYKTILQSSTCESICYNVRELGYSSHAIHNHTGSFYDRNTVFSQLGFDSFTPIEYMNDVEKNPLGWAVDRVLTPQILDALDSTAGQDFIFAISVQAHGRYPKERFAGEEQRIRLHCERMAEKQTELEYYVNQLYECDLFIGELIEALSERGEPVVLVVYGDHLPAVDFVPEDFTKGTLYQTDYILWSNDGMKKQDRDLEAYQLSAYVLGRLGMNNGILTKLHQNPPEDFEKYQENLEMLEYDMLYGDRESFGGISPHIKTDLVMGVRKIIVSDVRPSDEGLYLHGENFTPSSEVYIDGHHVSAEFIDPTALFAPKANLLPGGTVVIKQVTFDRTSLGQTEPFLYR